MVPGSGQPLTVTHSSLHPVDAGMLTWILWVAVAMGLLAAGVLWWMGRSVIETLPAAVATDGLRPEDVPQIDGHAPDAYSRLAEFALTYREEAEAVEIAELGRIANAALAKFQGTGDLPEDARTIRACLFFEQRRWRHFGQDPDSLTMSYCLALLARLREIL